MSLRNQIFKTFSSKKILIIGDVMVDSYMVGSVSRISPEAPVPIVSITQKEYRLGGAANVALNINALGAKVFLCSVIGNDEKGHIFEDLLKKSNLCSVGIIKDSECKTTVKTRVISNGQHLLRIDEEIDTIISERLQNEIIQRVESIIEKEQIDVIIFEDYDKGILSERLIRKIIEIAKNNNIRTAVDPKKRNFNFYSGVNLFKPNLKEFCEGYKIDKVFDLEKIKAYSNDFIDKNDIEILMITLSEYGVFICNKYDCIHIPAETRDIVDVSGAGDTVISVASILLSETKDLETIARISNIAGGLVCEKVGVVPIDLEILDTKISQK